MSLIEYYSIGNIIGITHLHFITHVNYTLQIDR